MRTAYVAVAVVAAAALALALALAVRGGGDDEAAVRLAVQLVDKLEWQVRSCQALGWLLGGTLAQLKALEQHTPVASLADRIDSDAIVLVLPNLQPEIRAHVAHAHQAFLRRLWGAGAVTPHAAGLRIINVWDPACAIIRRRY